MGLVEIGSGIFGMSRGDAIGSPLVIGDGAVRLKEAAKDFIEAKELFEKSRDTED